MLPAMPAEPESGNPHAILSMARAIIPRTPASRPQRAKTSGRKSTGVQQCREFRRFCWECAAALSAAVSKFPKGNSNNLSRFLLYSLLAAAMCWSPFLNFSSARSFRCRLATPFVRRRSSSAPSAERPRGRSLRHKPGNRTISASSPRSSTSWWTPSLISQTLQRRSGSRLAASGGRQATQSHACNCSRLRKSLRDDPAEAPAQPSRLSTTDPGR